MNPRRSLNLLVAAAGLVFLSGCTTEVVTDSAFWSYLPFTKKKSGFGSGGTSGTETQNVEPKAAESTGKNSKPSLRSEDAQNENWNEPASTGVPGQTSPGPKANGGTPAATNPNARRQSGASEKVPTPGAVATLPGLSVAEQARVTPPVQTLPAPTLGDAPSKEPRDAHGRALPQAPNPVTIKPAASSLHLPSIGDDAPAKDPAVAAAVPSVGTAIEKPASPLRRPVLPTLAKEADRRAPRTPISFPNVVLAGKNTPSGDILPAPATTGPNDGARDTGSLSLPSVNGATSANPATAATSRPNGWDGLGKGVVGSDQPSPTTHTLPNVLLQDPATLPATNGTALLTTPHDSAGKGSQSPKPLTGTSPGAPANATPVGGVVSGNFTLDPLAPKGPGNTAPLPSVGGAAPLPSKSIPAPYRLSEWISNDALHQAWRRQQVTRAQAEPEVRGSEQQRLRLVIDRFLLNDSAEPPVAK